MSWKILTTHGTFLITIHIISYADWRWADAQHCGVFVG
nr:MAG TPA: hypothetical protein [Caudoviricetes sp.]